MLILDSMRVRGLYALLRGTKVGLYYGKAQWRHPLYVLPTHLRNEAGALREPVLPHKTAISQVIPEFDDQQVGSHRQNQ